MKSIKFIYATALILLLNGALFSQNLNGIFSGCATDYLMSKNSKLLEYQKLIDDNAYKILKNAPIMSSRALATSTIPVVVHIIHNGGAENISDAQVQNAIANLNSIFKASNNAQVQFCLAQRDPNGNATNGITRNVSSLTTETMEVDDIALKNINRWSPTCYLNIWVVKEILSTSQGSGVAGYAYFPSAHGSAIDGVVIEPNYFGTSLANDAVGAHEIGHYLGLYHTFQNGCTNADCLNDGDKICDTPPDKTTFASCSPPTNSCSTDANDVSANNPFNSDVNDDSQNFMDYSSISCYTHFTIGQYDRMQYTVSNERKSLFNCKSCMSPCNTPVTAHITTPSGPLKITKGTNVNFNATSTNSSSYHWYINSNTVVSNTLSASYTFNTTGSFWMKFRAITNGNATLCGDAFDSIFVEVWEPAVVACAGSLEFIDPNSSVHLPLNKEFTSSNGFTWECWFKLNTDASSTTKPRILINASDLTPGEDIALSIGWSNPATIDNLVFNVDPPNNSGSSVNYAVNYKPPGGLVKNIWYHAAGVIDYNNHIAKLYLNGQPVSSLVNPLFAPLTIRAGGPAPGIPAVAIGWDAATGGSLPAANANEDEIRLWNTVRTDAEILNNYNQCLVGNEQNLQAYYRCNQSAGTLAIDASVNHYDGTIKNNAAWSVQEPAYIGTSCVSACRELCNNGIDDNSNGLIDEDCVCPEISVSRDTIICSGTSVILTASGATDYVWTPATTLSAATGNSVTASPTVNTKYTVVGTQAGPELILNGDFSLGNVDFKNTYNYVEKGYIAGTYFVGNDLFTNAPNPQWTGHTNPNSDMYATFQYANAVSTIWEQTVNSLKSNKDYRFSFWSTEGAIGAQYKRARYEVHFIGDITGDEIVSTFTAIQTPQSTWFWNESPVVKWNSRGNTNVKIKINNLEVNGDGNQYGVDDISLKSICTDTATVNVVIDKSPNTLNLGSDISLCVSGTHTFDAGPGFKEYKWQDGSTGRTFTAYGAGKYWVTVKRFCNSQILSDTVLIKLVPSPTLNLGSNITICKGQSKTLSFTSNGVYTSYQWSPPLGLNCTTCANPVASPLITTKYYLVASTSEGCTNMDSIKITVNPLPVVKVNSGTICLGSSIVLTASGATSYIWNTGAVINPISAKPTTTTSYTVTGKTNGCSNSAIAKVTVISTPTITVNSVTICLGSSATLTANGASSYQWLAQPGFSAVNGPTVIVKPTVTTTYTVTSTNPCGTGIAISKVTVLSKPIVTVNSQTICSGSIATLTANGATTYKWMGSGLITTTGGTVTAKPTVTTTYTVIGTNICGTGTAVSTVTVKPSPTVIVNNLHMCAGVTGELIAGGADTYTWSAGVTVTGVNTGTVSPSKTTIYTVTGYRNGCYGTALATVTVEVPDVTVNSVTICKGQDAILTASGADEYTWSTGSMSNPIIVSPQSTTSYTVIGTKGICKCPDTAIATVTVKPLPKVTVTSRTICQGETAFLSASGADTYDWSAGATAIGPNTATASPQVTTSYTVTGTTNGCSATAISTVTVPSITVNSVTICKGQTAVLTANGAMSYVWSNGAITPSISVSPATTTTYTVTGKVNGCIICSAKAIAKVTVKPVPVVTVNSLTVCQGATAILTANGANSYVWYTGQKGSTISVPTNNTGNFNYYVTGTQNGCASNLANAIVTVKPTPVVTVNSLTVCKDEPAILTAKGADTYVWYSGQQGSTISAPTNNTGNYNYYVTGTTNGCSSKLVNAIVKVNPLPTITINPASPNAILAGAAVQLTANGGVSYTWLSPTGVIGTTASITVRPRTTTTYTVTGVSADGCKNTAIVRVRVLSLFRTVEDSSSTINNYVLYPNPSNGDMTLNYVLAPEENGTLIIYDLLGRVLETYPLINTSTQLQINNSQLVNGTYIYCVLVNNNKVNCDKLIIAK